MNSMKNRKYFGYMFSLNPEKYMEKLKLFYETFSHKPKSLKELKRLALIEAKKVSQALMKYTKLSQQSRLEIILAADLVIQILESTFNAVKSLFTKINNNFKNERRKVYYDNNNYMEVIRKFEINKIKLFRYYIKNICKNSNISYPSLQKSVFYYMEQGNTQIVSLINSVSIIGKNYGLTPKSIEKIEVIDVLKKYHKYLSYLIQNNNKNNSDTLKYSLIIVNDIIYEHFGLEEEQIFGVLKENNNFNNDVEIKSLLEKIKILVTDNIESIFEV